MNNKPKTMNKKFPLPLYSVVSVEGKIAVAMGSSGGVDEMNVDAMVCARVKIDRTTRLVAKGAKMETFVYVRNMANIWVLAGSDMLNGQLGQSDGLWQLKRRAVEELQSNMVRRNIRDDPPSDEWSDDIFLAN